MASDNTYKLPKSRLSTPLVLPKSTARAWISANNTILSTHSSGHGRYRNSSSHFNILNCRIATSSSTTLHSVQHPSKPILHQVWNIANRVAVREEIPAASTVTVVVEPRTEDKVGRYRHECAI